MPFVPETPPPTTCVIEQGISQTQNLVEVAGYLNRFPELLWLADGEVEVTEEGTSVKEQGSWSEQLFGKKYPELERTATSLLCFDQILEGSERAYRAFTVAQPSEKRLSWDDFSEIHNCTVVLLRYHPHLAPEEVEEALRTALVLGDLGKSPKARNRFADHGTLPPDQDDCYAAMLAILEGSPHLSVSYQRLNAHQRALLTTTGTLIHYGHVSHLEGGPEMYRALHASGIANDNRYALVFDQLVHMLDVMGARGHVVNGSSLTYTAATHATLQQAYRSCWSLAKASATPETAYAKRVEQVVKQLHLAAENPDVTLLARLGAMLRLTQPEQGEALCVAFQHFSRDEKDLIARAFDPKNIPSHLPTPTYMPAVLINLVEHPDLSFEEGVKIGVPFLARVLLDYWGAIAKGELTETCRLNFNPVAGIAKEHPERLAKGAFTIEPDGKVVV